MFQVQELHLNAGQGKRVYEVRQDDMKDNLFFVILMHETYKAMSSYMSINISRFYQSLFHTHMPIRTTNKSAKNVTKYPIISFTHASYLSQRHQIARVLAKGERSHGGSA